MSSIPFIGEPSLDDDYGRMSDAEVARMDYEEEIGELNEKIRQLEEKGKELREVVELILETPFRALEWLRKEARKVLDA